MSILPLLDNMDCRRCAYVLPISSLLVLKRLFYLNLFLLQAQIFRQSSNSLQLFLLKSPLLFLLILLLLDLFNSYIIGSYFSLCFQYPVNYLRKSYLFNFFNTLLALDQSFELPLFFPPLLLQNPPLILNTVIPLKLFDGLIG